MEVVTKSGYFAFEGILPLQSILPSMFVCLQNWLISCNAHSIVLELWIVMLTTNKMVRSLNLCKQCTWTEAIYIKEGIAVCECKWECKLKVPILSNHFFVTFRQF